MGATPPLYVPPFDLVEEAMDPGPGITVHVVCDEELVFDRENELAALTDAIAISVLEPESIFWENEHLIGRLRAGLTYREFRMWVIRWWRQHVESTDPDYFVPPFVVGSIGEFDEPDGTWAAFEPEVLELHRDDVDRMLGSLLGATQDRSDGEVVKLASGVEWVEPSRVEIAGEREEQVIRDWLTGWWYHHVAMSER